MSENKNNDEMLELDLSNDSEDTLQINFDDLNTDVELSFDDLQDSVDVAPVDDNQPIENIELMSEHAPHNEPELTLESTPSGAEAEPELTLGATPSMDISLEEPKSDDISLSNDTKEDSTPVASTDPNSDPLGMDWQEPVKETVKANSQDKASTDTANKDLSVNISE